MNQQSYKGLPPGSLLKPLNKKSHLAPAHPLGTLEQGLREKARHAWIAKTVTTIQNSPHSVWGPSGEMRNMKAAQDFRRVIQGTLGDNAMHMSPEAVVSGLMKKLPADHPLNVKLREQALSDADKD